MPTLESRSEQASPPTLQVRARGEDHAVVYCVPPFSVASVGTVHESLRQLLVASNSCAECDLSRNVAEPSLNEVGDNSRNGVAIGNYGNNVFNNHIGIMPGKTFNPF